MRFLILGPHKSGKDAAAELLRDVFGLKYAGPTSKPILEKLLQLEDPTTISTEPHFIKMYNEVVPFISIYNSYEELYKVRHQIKDFLYVFGVLYREKFGNCSLVDMLLDQQTEVIVGLREKAEMEEVISSRAITDVVWVHRPGHTEDSTLEFNLIDVMYACDGVDDVRFTIFRNHTNLSRYTVDCYNTFKEMLRRYS